MTMQATRTIADVNADLGNRLVVETGLCTLLYGQCQRGADVASKCLMGRNG